jgi:hypothetical protein
METEQGRGLIFEVPPLDLSFVGVERDIWGQLGLERAWKLSRGQGVLIGILCGGVDVYEDGLRGHWAAPLRVCEGEDEQLGTFLASVIQRVAPAARFQAIECFPGLAGAGCEARWVARGIDRAHAAGVRVLLLPIFAYGWDEGVARACERAWKGGMVMVAPSGVDGLDQDCFPGLLEGVFGVAEWAEGGRRVKGASNLSEWTEILAPGELSSRLFGGRTVSGSLVATAVSAGVMALALGLDRGLGVEDLRSLILGGQGVSAEGFYRFHRAVPLDAGRLLELIGSGQGELVLKNLWVWPPLARLGESVEIWVTVENVGRGRVSGAIEIECEGGAEVLDLDFGVLRGGETRRLRGSLTASYGGGESARWVTLRGFGVLRVRESRVSFLPRGSLACESWSEPATYAFRVYEGFLQYQSAVIYQVRERRRGGGCYELDLLNTGNCPVRLECRVELDGILKRSELVCLSCGEGETLRIKKIVVDRVGSVPRNYELMFILSVLGGDLGWECSRVVLQKRGE